MKRWLASFLVVVLSAGICGLSGCRRNRETQGPGKRVTLRYVSYEYLPSQVAVQRAIIDAFNKSQDRVFVKFETAEKAGTEKILTQIAGGTAPDVFLWFNANVYDLAKKGAILRLDPFIKESGIDLNDYFPFLFNILRTNLDGLYAFPTAWGAEALAYNKDLFDKAGLPYPNENWTWDDFVRAAQKLTIKKEGRVVQYGTTLPPSHIVELSFGAKRFDEGLTQCVINSPEAKKAFQFLVDLGNKYKVIPSVSSLPRNEQYQTALDMFMTGRVAMFIITSFQLEALSKVKNIRWDVAPIPRYDQRPRTAAPGINTLVIYSKTKYPRECWEFIKFFCGPEGQKLLGRNCVPAHKGVTYQYFLSPPPEHLRVMIDQYERWTTFSEGYTSWGREYLETVYTRELDKMLLGLETVEQGTDIMYREGEKFLKANQ